MLYHQSGKKRYRACKGIGWHHLLWCLQSGWLYRWGRTVSFPWKSEHRLSRRQKHSSSIGWKASQRAGSNGSSDENHHACRHCPEHTSGNTKRTQLRKYAGKDKKGSPRDNILRGPFCTEKNRCGINSMTIFWGFKAILRVGSLSQNTFFHKISPICEMEVRFTIIIQSSVFS